MRVPGDTTNMRGSGKSRKPRNREKTYPVPFPPGRKARYHENRLPVAEQAMYWGKAKTDQKPAKAMGRNRSEQVGPGRRVIVLPLASPRRNKGLQESRRAVERSEGHTKEYETARGGEKNSKKDILLKMRARPGF